MAEFSQNSWGSTKMNLSPLLFGGSEQSNALNLSTDDREEGYAIGYGPKPWFDEQLRLLI